MRRSFEPSCSVQVLKGRTAPLYSAPTAVDDAARATEGEGNVDAPVWRIPREGGTVPKTHDKTYSRGPTSRSKAIRWSYVRRQQAPKRASKRAAKEAAASAVLAAAALLPAVPSSCAAAAEAVALSSRTDFTVSSQTRRLRAVTLSMEVASVSSSLSSLFSYPRKFVAPSAHRGK